jgi:hypothetical protein
MRTLTIRSVVLAWSLTTACVSTPRSVRSSSTDAAAITDEQLTERHYQNLYDAVLALRSNWLSTRGTDSFRAPSQVVVYLDDSRLGGVEALSGLSTQGISSVTHLNGIDATARWGIGHSAGAISVHTWPDGSRRTVADAPPAKDTTGGRGP